MTVTEQLMKPGRFTVKLVDDAPRSAWNAVTEFDHIVITPTRLEPLGQFTDSAILTAAKNGGYTGVITSKRRLNELGGQGLPFWLGTDDGVGDLLDAAVTNTAANLATWVTSLRPSSLSAGSVTSPGTTLSWTAQWITRREALDWVCRAVGAEWRVNHDFTLDAAAASALFVSTPRAVITRRTEMAEALTTVNYGLQGIDLDQARDVEGYTTKVIVVGKTGDGAPVAVGSATGANVYKDGLNNNVVLERLVNAPDTATGNVAALATATLGLYSSVRKSVTLTSDTYAVPTKVRVGDWVYVYDQGADLTDTANQVWWRGELIAPVLLRVRGMTWPIMRGMGVYARRSGATPTYTDLTDWVDWEDRPATWEVGTSYADPEQDPAQLSPAYLGSNPAVADRVAGVAGVTGITDSQTSTSALASGVSNTESYINLATPARATLAGRRYRIKFQFEVRAIQNVTSFYSVRIRRGTSTAGTTISGPTSFPKGAGTAPRNTVTIEAYDTPGAQASQQWCVTLLNDNAGLLDAYTPAYAVVEDCGPA